MAKPPDYYAVLGITLTASRAQVRAAYRRLAMQHHPDVNPPGEDDQAATDFMARLNEAYETLHDPAQRAAYDRARLTKNLPPPRPQHTAPPKADVDGSAPNASPPSAAKRRPHVPPNTLFEPSWLESYWTAKQHLKQQFAPLISLLAILAPVFAVAMFLVIAYGIYLLLSHDPQSVALATYLTTILGGPESLAVIGVLALLTAALWIILRASPPRR